MIKTKLISIPKGRLLVVGGLPEYANIQLPKNVTFDGSRGSLIYKDKNSNPVYIGLPSGNWQLIGKLSDVKEEDAHKVVEYFDVDDGKPAYENYVETNRYVNTARESLHSLVGANVPLRNKYDNESRPADISGPAEYLEEEETVFHNPILFFEPKSQKTHPVGA